MPIKRIHIENFKSFSEIDVVLSRFNVLIGSNAAGKSNFISVFRFLRDIARHGVVNAVALQGGGEYIRNAKVGNKRNLVVQVIYEPDSSEEATDRTSKGGSVIEVRSSESSYEFALDFNASGDGFSVVRDQLLIGYEVVSCGTGHSRKEKNPVIGRGSIRVSVVKGEVQYTVDIPEGCLLTENDIIPLFFKGKRLPERTLLLQTFYGCPLPHFDKFFDKIAVYDIDPKLPKKGMIITAKRELDENAGNLALVVKSILENPEKKRKFSNLLRDVLPFIEDFSVQKFMDVSLILTMRERYTKNRELPATSLSDGTIAIFAMIIALYFEKKPFIIIEEPVAHIHPFLIARLMRMMKEASEKKQVMITTHSTEAVKHADLDNLLLISRDNEGFSIISRPGDKEEVRTFLANEIGIEDLYAQNLLGF